MSTSVFCIFDSFSFDNDVGRLRNCSHAWLWTAVFWDFVPFSHRLLEQQALGHSLACLHVNLSAEGKGLSHFAVIALYPLGRMTGQRRLYQRWHLIWSVSVSVCPILYLHKFLRTFTRLSWIHTVLLIVTTACQEVKEEISMTLWIDRKWKRHPYCHSFWFISLYK